jgi:hypothetical protein
MGLIRLLEAHLNDYTKRADIPADLNMGGNFQAAKDLREHVSLWRHVFTFNGTPITGNYYLLPPTFETPFQKGDDGIYYIYDYSKVDKAFDKIEKAMDGGKLEGQKLIGLNPRSVDVIGEFLGDEIIVGSIKTTMKRRKSPTLDINSATIKMQAQGNGLMFKAYELLLLDGVTLVGWSHSKGAKKLWMKLASDPRFKIIINDEGRKRRVAVTKNDMVTADGESVYDQFGDLELSLR